MRITLFALSFLTISLLSCGSKDSNEGEYAVDSLFQTTTALRDSANQQIRTNRLEDTDSFSITRNELKVEKKVGDNLFSLKIDLPRYENPETNRRILDWINHHLQERIDEKSAFVPERIKKSGLKQFLDFQNQIYGGDVLNLNDLGRFYADKHFLLFGEEQLGINYNIECRKVYENKDIVSFEITEFFTNFAELKSESTTKGATFFKYDGSQLSWAMLEGSNVKGVVKNAVNSQNLNMSKENYEDFLRNSNYNAFTLPLNPPYMTYSGLKFVYRKKELSQKEGDKQIICTVPLSQLKLNPSLASML